MAKQTLVFDNFGHSEYDQMIKEWGLIGNPRVTMYSPTGIQHFHFDNGKVKWESLASVELFTLVDKWPLQPAPITTTRSSFPEVIEAEVIPPTETPKIISFPQPFSTTSSFSSLEPERVIQTPPPAPPEPEGDEDDEDQPRRKWKIGCRGPAMFGCGSILAIGLIGLVGMLLWALVGPKEDQHAGAPVPNQAPTVVQPADTPTTPSPEGTVVQEQEFDPKAVTTISVDQGYQASFTGKISVTYANTGKSSVTDISTGGNSLVNEPVNRFDWDGTNGKPQLPCPSLPVGQGYFKKAGKCSTVAQGPGKFQAGVNIPIGQEADYKSQGAKLQFRKLP